VAGRKKTVPSTREELEAICPLRPIQNEAEYDRARALAEKLVVLTDPTPLQEEWCDKLSDFLEKYEEVHYPI
jgi:antitoxin component HigA of HigAB toxin-antitoxin module